jgi:hypothetical protein
MVADTVVTSIGNMRGRIPTSSTRVVPRITPVFFQMRVRRIDIPLSTRRIQEPELIDPYRPMVLGHQ